MLGPLFLIFFVLLLLGMPIAFTMAVAGILVLAPSDLPVLVVSQKIFTALDSFTLMAIPFFMFAGCLMTETGITERIVDFANSVVGHITGGIAHTTSLAGILMAGISGSSTADASALGSILLPSLRKNGYGDGFSVSLVAASSVLGPIIPPSILMIIYSGITNISVAKLFLSGFVPGITIGIGYMIYSYFYAKKIGFRAKKMAPLKEIWIAFKRAIWALVMPLLIIVGVVSGVFTGTESGVVAVLYGLCYGVITRKLTLKKFWKSITEAVTNTIPALFIIATASIVSYVFTRENFSTLCMNVLESVTSDKHVTLLLIMAILVIMGMFIDSTAAMMMIVPVFMPLIEVYGYDVLHFAMIIILTLCTGGLTPPVGIVLYIVADMGHVPIKEIVKPVWPFVFIILFVVVIAVFIPEIITFVPNIFS